jgi:signal transduction histidine kinase
MRNTPYIFFALSILFGSLIELYAQNAQQKVIHLEIASTLHNIGEHIYIYQDETNNLKLEDILASKVQNEFKLGSQEVPSFGIKDVTIWLKLHIKNNLGRETPFVLEIAYPTLDSIFLYTKNDSQGNWNMEFAGDRVPFYQRIVEHRNFIFPLHLNSLETHTIYIKIKNKGSIIVPINIKPRTHLYSSNIKEELLYGIFYGIMIVMFLYNLVLAFAARTWNYIFYIGIIAGNLLSLSALNGHAFQYLWPDNPWWANHVIIFGIGLWISFGNLFAINFLESKHKIKAYHHIFKIMLVMGLLIMLSAFVVDYKTALLITNYILILNCLSLFTGGILFWMKGVKVARIFTLAWAVYLIGVILYTLRSLGYLPVNFMTNHALEIGAISEVILLSISLGYKYRLLEVDKKKAQKNALDIMTRSQEIIQQENESLEQKIKGRTNELHQKKEEVLQQNEKLNIKNEKLIEAQSIIQEQNKMLRKYNDDLEIKVIKRTKDLQLSNQELAQNVQQLEQYAYMTAHNLRAPVARILGLTNLLELSPEADKSEWINILSKVKDEGDSLDAVIRDMNAIIELRKGTDREFEEVHLKEKVNGIKRMLKNYLAETNSEIILDTSAFSSINSNPTYVESILYNLISNAIKYRKEDSQCLIKISTEILEEQKIIHVQDNGIGIDLNKYGNQLFGMYKRFHMHIEGKGLGLFLVKSQMEIMGGSIQVKSKPDEGATFSLIF